MIVHNFISWGFTHNGIDHHRNSVKVKYTQMRHKNIKFLNATVFFFYWHLKKQGQLLKIQFEIFIEFVYSMSMNFILVLVLHMVYPL